MDNIRCRAHTHGVQPCATTWVNCHDADGPALSELISLLMSSRIRQAPSYCTRHCWARQGCRSGSANWQSCQPSKNMVCADTQTLLDEVCKNTYLLAGATTVWAAQSLCCAAMLCHAVLCHSRKLLLSNTVSSSPTSAMWKCRIMAARPLTSRRLLTLTCKDRDDEGSRSTKTC